MAKRILVVEDVEDSRAILVLILQRYCGYETIEAVTGMEAIEKAIAEKPDLIVMDLGLPDITGVDAAKHSKAIQAPRIFRYRAQRMDKDPMAAGGTQCGNGKIS